MSWSYIVERNENGSLTIADSHTQEALHVLVPGTQWTSPDRVFFQMAIDGEFRMVDTT